MGHNRRAILVAGITLAAAVNTRASACSLTSLPRPVRFDDIACRRQITEIVEFFNRAPSMEEEAIVTWLDEHGSDDYDLFPQYNQNEPNSAEFVKNFKMSGGKIDEEPIKLIGVSLVKRKRNKAAYAFTLRRYIYVPADLEGCNGLFAHPELWEHRNAGYIAAFENNRMVKFREFPEWFEHD